MPQKTAEKKFNFQFKDSSFTSPLSAAEPSPVIQVDRWRREQLEEVYTSFAPTTVKNSHRTAALLQQHFTKTMLLHQMNLYSLFFLKEDQI